MTIFSINNYCHDPHLLHNCIKKYTSHLNKQRYKRRFRICLTIKHSVDKHSDRVGVCTRLWNNVWIHRAGLLGYFERKLLSGGVDNSSKRGCVDCEKYWPRDLALRNTKQQILLSRESRCYLYKVYKTFSNMIKKNIWEDLPLCHNMYQGFLQVFHDQ